MKGYTVGLGRKVPYYGDTHNYGEGIFQQVKKIKLIY